MKSELHQYYNERFKQEKDPPFETLSPDDIKRLKKIVEPSLGFAAWKLNKACNVAAKQFKITGEKLLVAFRLN